MRLSTPSDGPFWLKRFSDSILAAFKQVMDAPFRLWASDAASLPPPSDYEGGLAWLRDEQTVAYSDGGDWQRLLRADPTLEAFAAFDANGLIVQTAPDTFAGRTLIGPAAGISIANGDGVSGNPAIALANDLAAVEALSGTGIARRTGADTWTAGGAVTAAEGGTGQGSYAVGDLLYASAAAAISKLADVATGNVLISGGVGVAPSWGKAGLTTHVAGVLPVANGGTAQSSYAIGDLLYASGSATLARLADVATGNVLISGGVTTAPAWGKVGLATHVAGILPGANGGTNNGFMQFSGPATALKTFTLPNASDAIACLGTVQTFTAAQSWTGPARFASATQAVRFEGAISAAPTGAAGVGVEIGVLGGTCLYQSYNRTSLAYAAASIDAATVDIRPGGVSVAQFSSGGLAVTGAVSTTDKAVAGGGIRATGFSFAGTAGLGGELLAFGGEVNLNSYDRTASAYTVLNVQGSTVNIKPSGTTVMSVTTGAVSVTGTVTASGKVGVGTAGPTAQLNVVSPTAALPAAWIHNSNLVAGAQGLIASTGDNSATSYPFQVRCNNTAFNGGSALFYVSATGVTTIQVPIGSTTAAQLFIQGDNAGTLKNGLIQMDVGGNLLMKAYSGDVYLDAGGAASFFFRNGAGTTQASIAAGVGTFATTTKVQATTDSVPSFKVGTVSAGFNGGELIFYGAGGVDIAKVRGIYESDNLGKCYFYGLNGGTLGATGVCGPNGLGYPSGTGGSVTQATSKATAVTLNKTNGQVVMNAAALAANTSVAFTLSNSMIAATDVVNVAIASGASSLAYLIAVQATAAGSCSIVIRNVSAGSLSEALVINFAVLKAVAS